MPLTNDDITWFLIVYTLFTLIIFGASFKKPMAIFLAVLTLTIGFVLITLEHITHSVVVSVRY